LIASPEKIKKKTFVAPQLSKCEKVTLTQHVLSIDVVLHLESCRFHRKINSQFLDGHVLFVVAFNLFAVNFSDRTDIVCAEEENLKRSIGKQKATY
jgi:hypothetical protein